jgi:hypothetical protein
MKTLTWIIVNVTEMPKNLDVLGCLALFLASNDGRFT